MCTTCLGSLMNTLVNLGFHFKLDSYWVLKGFGGAIPWAKSFKLRAQGNEFLAYNNLCSLQRGWSPDYNLCTHDGPVRLGHNFLPLIIRRGNLARNLGEMLSAQNLTQSQVKSCRPSVSLTGTFEG